MSEARTSLPDYLGEEADEELVFDELPPVESGASSPEPASAETGRQGRKAVPEAIPTMLPSETMVPFPASETVLPASGEESAGTATAHFPPRATGPAGSATQPWLLAIVALALVTCLLSLGGLIAVSRTLARAGIDRQEAVAEKEALERVPALVAHLDSASVKLDEAAARLSAASPSGPPATIADIRREIDMLKLGLAQHQPEGMASLSGVTRDGFAEMAARLDRLSAQLDHATPKGDVGRR